MLSKDYKWYVITTKPRHELAVFRYFQSAGIKTYCPTEKVMVQKSDRRKLLTKPLFSMYVFVWISGREYLDVLHYNSVLDYVRIKGIPAIIPDREMLGLMEALSGRSKVEVSTAKFQKGQSIEIKSGPFSGLAGNIVTVRGCQKIQVRISCLEYSILLNAADLVHSKIRTGQPV